MIGSLENPPVVIRQSPRKLWLLAGVCLVFGLLMLRVAFSEESGWLYGTGGVFLLGAPFLVFRPSSLTLTPGGLMWRTQLRTFHYEWWQLSAFSAASFGYNNTVMFQYQKKRDGVHWPGSFGGLWEIGPGPLAALLNTAREKWS